VATMPFLHDPLAVLRVLRLVRLTSHPRVVSASHLQDLGFATDEIPGLVHLLTELGMIDGRHQPTSTWTEYQHSPAPRRVLVRAMRGAYAPFFATLDRPDRHDDVALDLIVRDRTDLEPRHVDQVVATFRTLCTAAGLGHASHARVLPAEPPAHPDRAAVLHEVGELLAIGHTELANAHACLSAEQHRAAHVAAWNGLAAMGFTRLAAGEFAGLRAVRTDWQVLTVAELARRATGRVLVDLLTEIGAIEPLEEFTIAALLERRDRCARPSSYRPTADQTRLYLDEIVACAAILSPGAAPVSGQPVDAAASRPRQPTPPR